MVKVTALSASRHSRNVNRQGQKFERDGHLHFQEMAFDIEFLLTAYLHSSPAIRTRELRIGEDQSKRAYKIKRQGSNPG